MTTTTEAAAISEIAREADRFNVRVEPVEGSVHTNVLKDNEHLDVKSHERYSELPHRPRGEAVVTDVDSFVQMLARPMHEQSVVFANESSSSLTAVLNFDGWRDHIIKLVLRRSDAMERWITRDGQLYPQDQFAELIEDGLADIIEPDAADMLELAQTFQATKEVAFESGTRIASGAVRFQYAETIDAKAGRGGELQVPSSFVLGIPIYRGGARIQVRANLRYRIGRGGLQLGFKIVALDDILRGAFEAVVASVSDAINTDAHQIVLGVAPSPINPLP